MNPTVKAVLLDLDGTLLDTVPDLHIAANAMLRELGRPEVAIEATRSYVGRGIQNLVKRLLAGRIEAVDDPAPPPADALESFKRHYAGVNGRHTTVFPGVMEGLAALKAKGLPLAVITNKSAVFVGPLLERMGLAPFFDAVVGGDTLPKSKPDPMPVVWACGRLGVSPLDAVLIGDSVNDCKAGRAAGCRVLLVPYGYNEGRGVQGLEADAIVGSIIEAAQFISPK